MFPLPELTLLGFIGLIIFTVNKFGGLSDLSPKIFGEGHDEELAETIENVHFVLFFVMMLFIGTVVMSIYLGSRALRKWKSMELLAASEVAVAQQFLTEPRGCGNVLEPPSAERTLIYTSLRREFLSPRTAKLAGGGHHGGGHYSGSHHGETPATLARVGGEAPVVISVRRVCLFTYVVLVAHRTSTRISILQSTWRFCWGTPSRRWWKCRR